MKKEKKSKTKSRFGSNVVSDVDRQKNSKSFGYLKLPPGVSVFKHQAGKTRTVLDIIPYIVTLDKHPDMNPDDSGTAHKGQPWYKLPITVHHGIGAGKNKETLMCPTTIGKSKCPICEEAAKQFKDGVDSKKVVGKTSLRNLYVVIPKKMEDFENEMHIWDIAQGNFQKELNKDLEEKPELGVFPDPVDGQTLTIRFTEESYAGNKYAEASRIDYDDRKKPYKLSIMKEAPCLDECIKVLSYKELRAKFFALDDDDDDDDNTKGFKTKEEKRKKKKLIKEEEKPAKNKKAKSKGKKSKCPSGYKFGKDWDDYSECNTCSKLDACGAASEQ